MRDPVAGQTSLAIVGASGMVGGYALRYSLDNPAIGVVTVIGISHPKLKEVCIKTSPTAPRSHSR